MSKYVRLPQTVDAFQYTGQRLDALPEWAKAHRAMTAMGEQNIGKDAVGQLLVPSSFDGAVLTARFDDFVVLTGDKVSVVKKDVFLADYQAVEAAADEVATEVVEPTPAPAAEPAKAVKGKDAAPATDAPAAAEEPAADAS